MHSHQYGTTVFIYNGDYSGDVKIMRISEHEHKPLLTTDAYESLPTIPSADLFAFIAGAVRDIKISTMEGATPSEILGLPANKERDSRID